MTAFLIILDVLIALSLIGLVLLHSGRAVSYTHLTLPTILLV